MAMCWREAVLYLFLSAAVWLTTQSAAGDDVSISSDGQVIDQRENRDSDYEVVKKIHMHLDDDRDGTVELKESTDFIKDELGQAALMTAKRDRFHQRDMGVTVKELWSTWSHSSVYNWTTDEVVIWLTDVVNLGKYEAQFRKEEINGSMLPRVAMNVNSILQKRLGINSDRDRKKLQLRAMDLVLFGPIALPGRNRLFDYFLLTLTISCALGLWWSLKQKKQAEKRVSTLLWNLNSAEECLQQLQSSMYSDVDLGQSREESPVNMLSNENERSYSPQPSTYGSVSEIRAELQTLYKMKSDLLGEVQFIQNIPTQFYQLLQQTYKMEKKHWEEKKVIAEKELLNARKQCEKLNRKRVSFLSSLRMANSSALQDTDHQINHAIITLNEVKEGLEEFGTRWRHIEHFCHLPLATKVSYSDTDVTERKNHVGRPLDGQSTPPLKARKQNSQLSDTDSGKGGSFDSQSLSSYSWSVGDFSRSNSSDTDTIDAILTQRLKQPIPQGPSRSISNPISKSLSDQNVRRSGFVEEVTKNEGTKSKNQKISTKSVRIDEDSMTTISEVSSSGSRESIDNGNSEVIEGNSKTNKSVLRRFKQKMTQL